MRPKHTSKDDNHFIPRDFLRDRCGGFEDVQYGRTRAYTANYQGYRFVLWDTADFGGVWGDWLLLCETTGAVRFLEIKTPEAYRAKDHSLKDGEKWLLNAVPHSHRFVTTDEEMQEIVEWMTHSH